MHQCYGGGIAGRKGSVGLVSHLLETRSFWCIIFAFKMLRHRWRTGLLRAFLSLWGNLGRSPNPLVGRGRRSIVGDGRSGNRKCLFSLTSGQLSLLPSVEWKIVLFIVSYGVNCDWLGAMVCLLAAPWVQLSFSACNGWPHNALRYHWAHANQLPLSRLYKALLVASLTDVSGAITSVQNLTFRRVDDRGSSPAHMCKRWH